MWCPGHAAASRGKSSSRRGRGKHPVLLGTDWGLVGGGADEMNCAKPSGTVRLPLHALLRLETSLNACSFAVLKLELLGLWSTF
jgi:hypothetical protein